MANLSRTEKTLIVAGAVVAFTTYLAFAFGFVVRAFRNASNAMEPSFKKGETLIVRRTKKIARGDVVAFHVPSDPRVTLAKRAVALGGDVVEIRSKELFINDQRVQEPYVEHLDPTIYPKMPQLPEPYRSRDQFGPYEVPAGQFFALGDNRDRSHDSRYFGSVPIDQVIGRVTATFSWRHGFRKVR